MNPQLLPATARDDVPAWQQTVVAFLAENAIDRARIDRQIRELALDHAAGALGDDAYLARLEALRGQRDALTERTVVGLSGHRAVEWLRALGETVQRSDVPVEKADLMHAVYERIVVAGRRSSGSASRRRPTPTGWCWRCRKGRNGAPDRIQPRGCHNDPDPDRGSESWSRDRGRLIQSDSVFRPATRRGRSVHRKGGAVSNAGSGERLQDDVDRLRGEVAELRRSRRRLVEVAFADRRAIERALHDGVQQHLVAFAVELRRLAGLVEADPAAAKAMLDEMAAKVREALDATTELAQTVYPPLLEARGFASAIRSAAERAGVTVVVDVPAGADYPPEMTAAVYWSCVEALSSASRGSHATVSVLDADDVLTFEVAIAGHHPEGSLARLRDRIEALDGRVSVDEGQDGGSRVHGWLPLSR